jgi:hypothetical protein
VFASLNLTTGLQTATLYEKCAPGAALPRKARIFIKSAYVGFNQSNQSNCYGGAEKLLRKGHLCNTSQGFPGMVDVSKSKTGQTDNGF